MRILLWIIRRVIFGPTYYDMWQKHRTLSWNAACMIHGGGVLLHRNRMGVPKLLRYAGRSGKVRDWRGD